MDDDMIKSIFPSGLHILLVDDDAKFLGSLEMMLLSCHYKVTACKNSISALSILLEQPDKFDLLLTDLEMPEMNGYELLKIVNGKLRIPVIMMSIDATTEVMMKGIREGACYFLHKPISINLLRKLWVHVVWKKFSNDKEMKRLHRNSEKRKAPLVSDSRSPVDQASSKGIRIDDGSNKGKMKQVQEKENDTAIPKKRRTIWTPELNQRFEEAVEQLGIEQAIPSKITQLMNVEGIDRQHVSSHLQKYRISLRQEKERQESYLNRFHCTMNPSNQGEYMGMGSNNISGPSSNPVPVPQAAIHPKWDTVPGTGNAILGSFSGSVQPQQEVGGCAQQYRNTNYFPDTTFGAIDVGINAQTSSTNNPAQNIGEENSVPITEFASFNNNFQAPGTSIPGCHAAGGLAPSGLLMGSNQSLPTNMVQENLGVHEAASSSSPTEHDDMDKFLEDFLKEDIW